MGAMAGATASRCAFSAHDPIASCCMPQHLLPHPEAACKQAFFALLALLVGALLHVLRQRKPATPSQPTRSVINGLFQTKLASAQVSPWLADVSADLHAPDAR